MTKIFISHSSKDKPSILRLAKDLRRNCIDVWLDQWEIDVGDDIVSKVQEGLKGASHVAVWLTSNSVQSGWVTKEWHRAIFSEISDKGIVVLPLLAQECELPYFLADKKYADFRCHYDTGFDELLRTLKKRSPTQKSDTFNDTSTSILQHTEHFLNDLDGSQIPIPSVGSIKIIKSLKTLPRSGKLLRLENMTPRLPIRSVYDHVLSIAHTADCIIPHVGINLSGKDRIDLARIIAYHDICEVILGDVPQYTRLNRSKRGRAKITAEIRISQLPEGYPEKVVNEFIGMYLHDSERQSLKTAYSMLSSQSQLKQFFYVLDKIDPIIAVWRYIHIFRRENGMRIDEFLERMRHFFDNPGAAKAVSKNFPDGKIMDLVGQLQSIDNARAYCRDMEIIRSRLFDFSEETVRTLIEGRGMLFAK